MVSGGFESVAKEPESGQLQGVFSDSGDSPFSPDPLDGGGVDTDFSLRGLQAVRIKMHTAHANCEILVFMPTKLETCSCKSVQHSITALLVIARPYISREFPKRAADASAQSCQPL